MWLVTLPYGYCIYKANLISFHTLRCPCVSCCVEEWKPHSAVYLAVSFL